MVGPYNYVSVRFEAVFCVFYFSEVRKTHIYILRVYPHRLHIPGIDVGGGWRTGCGSHPPSAERVEELEVSVWSVVRQEIEREDQGEGVQNSGKTSTGVRGRDMGVEEGTGKEIGGRRNENATMDVRSYEAGQEQK